MDLTILARERVGKVLRGKYHLDRLIDVGGMAAVYEATHRNGTRSAIKVLHPKYVSDVQARTRFLREGYAANHVGHPGSVTVIDDDFTEEGDVYLVMELLDGESLEGCIAREKTMNEVDVLSIADQLLDVLSSAHNKDIIHRDIKPANIMLTRSGIVKLLDFGLARVRELPAVAGVHSAEIVFGTVAYVSPEAARANNDEMDGRADLWAVAATMFKALAGETVHGMNGSVMERLIRAAKDQARSLGAIAPHLHPRVVDLVDRALMFNREDRWPSAAVMQAVTQDVLAQLMEERAVPPSMFFMPGLSQMVAGYAASGPMTSMSASYSPTPRPFRGQMATPSPSPYPYPGAMATPTPRPAPNPLNQVSHNPLNQVRGRAAQPSYPDQGSAGYTTNYANPLNQVASRPRSAPQVQPQRQNPLNRVAAPSHSHQRSPGEPQNQAPTSYPQRQTIQTRGYGAVDPGDSSFDIEIEDLDPGSSAGDLDLAITIEESREAPAPRPRRATTMRDLGSAAARARAMLDSRRRGVMAPTPAPTPAPAPAPAPEPEPELEEDSDFDIDIGFEDDFTDVDDHSVPEDVVVDTGGDAVEVDTVRRPPPTLPSEETVRRPAPTGPSFEAKGRSEDTVRGPAPLPESFRQGDSHSGMEPGIIIEQLDDDEGWPEDDPWGTGAVSGEISDESRVYDEVDEADEDDDVEAAHVEDAGAVDEAEPTPDLTDGPRLPATPESSVSGLLGLPPLSSGLSGARTFGAPLSRADAEAKREAAEAKRQAAEAERKAVLAERRAAAAEERKAAAEQRRLQARQAAELREQERLKRRSGKPLPPRPKGGGLGLERLSSLRRPPEAPVVVDRDSPTLTSPDRTVRVAIPTPTTLPDLGVGQRSSRAPAVPRVSPPRVQVPAPPKEADESEEVAELSDSMFVRVPEANKPAPVVPPKVPAPPARTPVPPVVGSSPRRPSKLPARPPAKKPEGKPTGDKPALRLPRLRKLPPRKK